MRLIAVRKSGAVLVHAAKDDSKAREPQYYGRVSFEILCLQPESSGFKVDILGSSDDSYTTDAYGHRTVHHAGLDYLRYLGLWKRQNRCNTCYRRAKLIEKYSIDSSMFTFLRRNSIPYPEWEEYSKYPVEWAEAMIKNSGDLK